MNDCRRENFPFGSWPIHISGRPLMRCRDGFFPAGDPWTGWTLPSLFTSVQPLPPPLILLWWRHGSLSLSANSNNKDKTLRVRLTVMNVELDTSILITNWADVKVGTLKATARDWFHFIFGLYIKTKNKTVSLICSKTSSCYLTVFSQNLNFW